MSAAEQRARDDALVLGALPGTRKELAEYVAALRGIPERQIYAETLNTALSRLKRAGLIRHNRGRWERTPDARTGGREG